VTSEGGRGGSEYSISAAAGDFDGMKDRPVGVRVEEYYAVPQSRDGTFADATKTAGLDNRAGGQWRRRGWTGSRWDSDLFIVNYVKWERRKSRRAW
jgi:hypothetical protein